MQLKDILTLIVFSLALLVSGLALGWNILSHLLTGQRVKLHVAAMKVFDHDARKELRPVIAITVRAIGRAPVEVTGWSLSFPDDLFVHSDILRLQYSKFHDIQWGDELPKVIAAGAGGYLCA